MEEQKEQVYLGENMADEPEANEQGLTLLDYLCANPVGGEIGEVKLQGRLKDFTFRLDTMNKKQHETYMKQTIIRNGGKVIEQKTKLFNELVVINHCLYPNFKDPETLQQAGEMDPIKALNKLLKVGEVEQLARAILEFNGFAMDASEVTVKAKN